MEPDLTDTIQTWRGMYGNHIHGPWTDRGRGQGTAPGRAAEAAMTQDGPRTETTLRQLQDGSWLALIDLPGERIEVYGVTRTEALERVMMVLAEIGDER